MKKNYVRPDVERVRFQENEDIMSLSGNGGAEQVPDGVTPVSGL